MSSTGPYSHSLRRRQAMRVASTVGVVKWIIIVLTLLSGIVVFFAGLAADGSGSDAVAVGTLVMAAAYSLVTWVLFGWFEHSLGLLSDISQNTSGQ